MPDYIVTSPDGQKYRVSGQGTAEEALAHIQQMQGGQPEQVGVGEDIAKGAGSGLVEGAFSIPGMVGDTVDLVRAGGTWVGNQARKMAGKQPIQGQAPDPLGLSSIPGSQDLMEMTGFEPYEPQTRAGKFARTAASFVPAAATFNAGGGVKNAVSGALKYGVAPGLASEGAGQLTEGTAYEPYARVGGALLGAGLASGATGAAKYAMRPKDPALEPIFDKARRLKDYAGRLYDQVDAAGIQVDPISLQAGVSRIEGMIAREGLSGKTVPAETKRALAILNDIATRPQTFKQLDKARQAVKEAFSYNSPSESRLATLVTKEFDGFINSLGPQDIISSANPQQTVQALNRARGVWGQAAGLGDKADLMNKMWQSALDKVGANYSKAGIMTALRQEFRGLNRMIRNDADIARLFTGAEREAINKIVRGGTVENGLRAFGKLAPVSPSSLAVTSAGLGGPAAGIGFLAGGPVGAAIGAAVPAAVSVGVGAPARIGANVIQRRNIDDLAAMILNKGRPPLPLVGARFNAGIAATYATDPVRRPLEVTVPVPARRPPAR
jgi:hypothetical protein